MRIGQSKDVHRLVEGRKLIIGGVEIPYEKGLLGHSDADVLLHAIIESLIGAMGLKDIGTHFPDTDPRYEGISSLLLLDETRRMLEENGYEVVNLDSLIMIEEPKMAPHIDQMRKNIAEHLHIPESRVNVKATRGEGMGFVGHKEGVLAECVCLIDEKGRTLL